MNPKSKFQYLTLKQLSAALLLFLPFFISALTCGAPVQDESQKQIDAVQDVQTTLDAQKVMTLEAQQTASASEETTIAQSTIIAPTTVAPSRTSTEPPTATPLPSPTANIPTPTLELTAIPITEWIMQYWVLSLGCRIPNTPCWKTNDDVKIHNGEGMLVLLSQKRVYIDPSSKSPYLVFLHKPELRQGANVSIEVDGKWIIVMNLTKRISNVWSREYIDLSNFKGKNILIRFISDLNPNRPELVFGGYNRRVNKYSKRSVWFVQDVQILPECTPP